jgi:hypothetical protein
MNPRIRKGKLSMYKNNPKINPAKIKINIAKTESGLDEKMIRPIAKKAEDVTKLPRSIQRTSHSRKRMGRYIPLQNRRDRVMAISIVKAIKVNKIKNKAVSVENSVE